MGKANLRCMTLPMPDRKTADLPGHWLFARLGKRVLRPGGLGLTHRMLADAKLPGVDVVELAPGMGRTAREILDRTPGTYTGVEADPNAAEAVRSVVGDKGRVVTGEAAATGLDADSADVVVGEAMLTMQTHAHKAEIAREALRVLRCIGHSSSRHLLEVKVRFGQETVRSSSTWPPCGTSIAPNFRSWPHCSPTKRGSSPGPF